MHSFSRKSLEGWQPKPSIVSQPGFLIAQNQGSCIYSSLALFLLIHASIVAAMNLVNIARIGSISSSAHTEVCQAGRRHSSFIFGTPPPPERCLVRLITAPMFPKFRISRRRLILHDTHQMHRSMQALIDILIRPCAMVCQNEFLGRRHAGQHAGHILERFIELPLELRLWGFRNLCRLRVRSNTG